MAKKLKKCPVCGEKLQPISGRMRCTSCGYSVNIDGSYGNVTTSTGGMQSTYTGNRDGMPTAGNPLPGGRMFDYNTDHQNPAKNTTAKPDKASRNIKNVVRIIASTVTLLVVVVTLYMLFQQFEDGNFGENGSNNNGYGYGTGNGSAAKEDDKDEEDDTEKFRLPESDLYQAFAEAAFGRDYRLVTAEEYRSVTSIHVYHYEKRIDYTINDGELQTFLYNRVLYDRLSDLSCFPGLKSINMEAETLMSNDIAGLKNLEEIWSDNTPTQLSKLVVNRDKIKVIGLYETFFTKSLDELENFPNLETLYIASREIEDISALKNLKNLKELTIVNGYNISDFSALTELTGLKKLDITSSSLKNLGFLKYLSSIEELSVSESDIISIGELEEHKNTLKKVMLLENYSLKDYTELKELTGLEELGISTSYDAVIPSLSGMTSLKSLFLEGTGYISVAATAPGLTELTLSRCSLNELEELSALKNLKTLQIDNSNSYIKDLHPLMSITSLECLDISNTRVYGNVEELLSLPALREFYMNDSRVCFDFDKVQKNESLSVLGMNNLTVMKYDEPNAAGYVDTSTGEKVAVAEHMDFVKNFSGLTELYVRGNMLDDLSFATELKELKLLDISNNYISSLVPLLELENLETVWCEKNTIVEGTELASRVNIIMSN